MRVRSLPLAALILACALILPAAAAAAAADGSVAGTITAASGGAPLPNALACAYEFGSSDFVDCESTDGDGEYTLDELDPGTYKVELVPPFGSNYVVQYYDGMSSFADADPVVVSSGATTEDVDAALVEGGQISGHVTEAGTGEDVEGFQVCGFEYSSGDYAGCVLTDESGEYTLPGLVSGSYRVTFEGGFESDYIAQYYDGRSSYFDADPVAVTAGSTTSAIDAELELGGKVSGHVSEAVSGDPVEEGVEVCARVNLGVGPPTSCASVSSGGAYTISGLPTGSYRISFLSATCGCEPGKYLPQYYNGKATLAASDLVAVTAGGTTSGIDAALEIGGEIEGRLTDALTGDPIEVGVVACAFSVGGGSFVGCGLVEEGGFYTIIGVPTGSYVVAFSAAPFCGPGGCITGNYLTQYYDGKATFAAADPVAVTAGEVVEDIDAAMVPGGRITGLVTDAASGDPVEEGVKVCARAAGGFSPYCTEVDADGEYTIVALSTGSYKVEFRASFSCGGPEGCAATNYLTQYYNGKATQSAADPVAVTAGATTSGIGAAMQAGGQISGEVTAAVGGAPLEEADVCIHESSSESLIKCEETDADGKYTVSGLPTGSYKVEFSPGFDCGIEGCTRRNFARQYYDGRATLAAADPVAVTAGSAVTGINAAMQPGGQIEGTVTDSDSGDPIAAVSVCAREPDEEGSLSCGKTDGDGEYTVQGLSTGDFEVDFLGPSGSDYVHQYYDGKVSRAAADKVAVVAGATKTGIDAALEEGGAISGQVTEAAGGTPLREAYVCAYRSGGEETETCAETNLNGEYAIHGLAAGSYAVEFGPPYTCGIDGCGSLNYVRQFFSGKSTRAAADSVAVSAGATTEDIDAALQEGGRISGLVTDAASGQPIFEVEVCAYPVAGGTAESCAEPGIDGSYVIAGLPAGQYKVEFAPELACTPETCFPSDYIVQYYDGEPTLAAADPVSVAIGNTREGVDASMLKPGGAIPVETSAPQLTGTPAVGQTLSCSDGLWNNTPTSFARVWQRDGTPIGGETAATYVVGAADAGHSISCEVTATNGAGSASATSNTVNIPAKPVNTALPQITGTPAVGETLTCSDGSWNNSPTSFARAWLRDGAPIATQTATTYVVQPADRDHTLSCEVTATNSSGSSSATSVVLRVPAKPVNTLAPQLTGTPAVGSTLSCTQGSWDFAPTGYAYAWLRGATPISGQSAATYEVQAGDRGSSLTCEVTATNGDGSTSAASNSIAIPAPVGAPVNTALPQITGTPAVGETLTCSDGSWNNSPTSFARAWLRDGTPIATQTATTYVVQAIDAGSAIRCEVTATNSGGSASALSAVVNVPAKPVNTALPQITGTPTVGQTLTCSDGSWNNAPTSFARVWLRDGGAISGKTAATYEVQSADAAHLLSCRVTATNGGGSTGATSADVSVPAPVVAPVNTGAPQLTGTPAVGQTLTCSDGLWNNAPTSFARVWQRDGTPIGGKVAGTYLVQTDDQGHALTCRVTASNSGGSSGATSNALQVPAAESKPSDRGTLPVNPVLPPAATPGLAAAAAVATVKGGSAAVALQCSGGACSGTVKLVVKAKGKELEIGAAGFSIAAGQSATVQVKLTGKGKSLLGKRGKRGLKVQLTGAGVQARSLTLKGSSKGKKSHKRAARSLL